MKKYALIVAAGSGSRMESDIPKQFLLLNDRPLYTYSINVFLQTFPDIEIILVLPQAFFDEDPEKYFPDCSRIKKVVGGSSRFESVQNGLNQILDSGIVFIHDAVRPFIENEFLKMLFETASATGNAIPCISLNDSIRVLENGKSKPVDRSVYRAVQTPQVFRTDLIKKAYEESVHSNFTDDATVLESNGTEVVLVEGLVSNIKITRPVDLKIAEVISRLPG